MHKPGYLRLCFFCVAALVIHALFFGGLFFSCPQVSQPSAGGGGGVEIIGLGGTGTASRVMKKTSDSGNTLQPTQDLQAGGSPLPVGAGTGEESGAGSGPGGQDSLLGQIRARIENAKRYPELARKSGIEGSCSLSFKIMEAGQATEIKILKSSGNSLLDEAALEAVRRAASLPYFPEPLEVVLKFILQEN